MPIKLVSSVARRVATVRYDIPAHKVISQNLLAAHWKEFIAYHTSQAFYEVGGGRAVANRI